MVKLLLTANTSPPVAEEYHVMVAVASVLVAVKVAELPGQIEAPVVVAAGAGLMVTTTGVRVDAQPVLLVASA